jgi:hypothetical protein
LPICPSTKSRTGWVGGPGRMMGYHSGDRICCCSYGKSKWAIVARAARIPSSSSGERSPLLLEGSPVRPVRWPLGRCETIPYSAHTGARRWFSAVPFNTVGNPPPHPVLPFSPTSLHHTILTGNTAILVALTGIWCPVF